MLAVTHLGNVLDSMIHSAPPAIPPTALNRDLDRTLIRRQRDRTSLEPLLRCAAFLPPEEFRLIRDHFQLNLSLRALALQRGQSVSALRRELLSLRRRALDPCFLLTIQFSRRLPAPLAILARLHFRRGLTLAQIASEENLSLHHVRHSLALARTLLILAASERYGGRDPQAQTFLTALLSAKTPRARTSRERTPRRIVPGPGNPRTAHQYRECKRAPLTPAPQRPSPRAGDKAPLAPACLVANPPAQQPRGADKNPPPSVRHPRRAYRVRRVCRTVFAPFNSPAPPPQELRPLVPSLSH